MAIGDIQRISVSNIYLKLNLFHSFINIIMGLERQSEQAAWRISDKQVMMEGVSHTGVSFC